jgi:hypothetical protein
MVPGTFRFLNLGGIQMPNLVGESNNDSVAAVLGFNTDRGTGV